MHDIGSDSGMGYVRGESNDSNVVVGTVIENFKSKPSFGGNKENPITQKEPTECTAFKLPRLWGIPENKFGTTGFSCNSSDDCKEGYECLNNQCMQQCTYKPIGSKTSRDEKEDVFVEKIHIV